MRKEIFKKLISLVLAAVMTFGAGAAAVSALESDPKFPLGTEYTEYDSLEYDPENGIDVFSGYNPEYERWYQSYFNDVFSDLMTLYEETHLYEFTREELAEAFIMKLIHDNPELLAMYMNTLLGTMDEYSSYYPAGTGLAGDGSTGGYGFSVGDAQEYEIRTLGISDDGLYITSVLPGTKAQEAGLQVGDKIVSVEGIPIAGLTIDAAMYLIRYLPYVEKEQFDENGQSLGIPNEPEYIINEETGKKQYILNMTLERGASTYDVKLIKGRMIPSSVTMQIPQGKSYAYIAISDFTGDNVVADFEAALIKASSARRDDLIIDLRNNGGGVLEYAVQMANLLIEEEGRILYYENARTSEKLKVTKSVGGGMTFGKITVIVNGNTASAAELFAMMLSYNCSAITVGETTYGKAVGQYSYGMQNGDMFTITSFEILDPLKNSYNQVGITPDVIMGDGLAQLEFPNDLEVFNYINYKELSEGSTGDVVMGLERRLELMGYLKTEYVDGVYDSATSAAISSLRTYCNRAPTPLLEDADVEYITLIINKYKHYFYTFDAQFEVAEMSFSSRSQAKRRAKELEKASEIARKAKADYEAEVLAQIKAEDEAEMKRREEEERAAEEAKKAAENGDGAVVPGEVPGGEPEVVPEVEPAVEPEVAPATAPAVEPEVESEVAPEIAPAVEPEVAAEIES